MKANRHRTRNGKRRPTAGRSWSRDRGRRCPPTMADVLDTLAMAWPKEICESRTNEAAAVLGSLAIERPDLRRELIELIRGIVRDREPNPALA